jgi:membrane protease YdiL (CAAX protease family)
MKAVEDVDVDEYGSVGPRRLPIRLEVAVVLLAFSIPHVVSWFLYPFYRPDFASWRENLHDIAYNLGSIGVVGFLLWTSGDDLRSFGIRVPAKKDVVIFAVLLVVLLILAALRLRFVDPIPDEFYDYLRGRVPSTPLTWFFLTLGFAFSALWEELAYRCYLLPRLAEIFRSQVSSTIIASGLFALGHLYQGLIGAGGALVMGFAFSLGFWRSRSLLPLFVAHFAYNMLLAVFVSNPFVP